MLISLWRGLFTWKCANKNIVKSRFFSDWETTQVRRRKRANQWRCGALLLSIRWVSRFVCIKRELSTTSWYALKRSAKYIFTLCFSNRQYILSKVAALRSPISQSISRRVVRQYAFHIQITFFLTVENDAFRQVQPKFRLLGLVFGNVLLQSHWPSAILLCCGNSLKLRLCGTIILHSTKQQLLRLAFRIFDHLLAWIENRNLCTENTACLFAIQLWCNS